MENTKPTRVTYRSESWPTGKIITDEVLDWNPAARRVTINRPTIHAPHVRLVITFDQVISFEFDGCVNDLR